MGRRVTPQPHPAVPPKLGGTAVPSHSCAWVGRSGQRRGGLPRSDRTVTAEPRVTHGTRTPAARPPSGRAAVPHAWTRAHTPGFIYKRSL